MITRLQQPARRSCWNSNRLMAGTLDSQMDLHQPQKDFQLRQQVQLEFWSEERVLRACLGERFELWY